MNQHAFGADRTTQKLRLSSEELVDRLRVDPVLLHAAENEAGNRRRAHSQANGHGRADPASTGRIFDLVATAT
jgi:hypothetical protein